MKIAPGPHPFRNRSKGIYLLPNLFTTAALFAGFYAVVSAIDGNYRPAAVAIFVAMVMDALDGRVARMTNTVSDFGKEYDSLADMVSFGLAPALIVYQWGAAQLAVSGAAWGKLGWLAAFFYAVTAALRLARFNSRSDESDASHAHWEGLPSPSAAGVVAGTIWVVTEWDLGPSIGLVGTFCMMVLCGALMVSNVPYKNFKELNLSGRVNFAHLLLIPVIFMFVALDPPIVLFGLFLIYTISGPLTLVWRLVRRRRNDETPPVDRTGSDG